MRNDFVRLVQQARKESGLHVSDRIVLYFEVDAETTAVLTQNADYIEAQVLATSLTPQQPLGTDAVAGRSAAATASRYAFDSQGLTQDGSLQPLCRAHPLRVDWAAVANMEKDQRGFLAGRRLCPL